MSHCTGAFLYRTKKKCGFKTCENLLRAKEAEGKDAEPLQTEGVGGYSPPPPAWGRPPLALRHLHAAVGLPRHWGTSLQAPQTRQQWALALLPGPRWASGKSRCIREPGQCSRGHGSASCHANTKTNTTPLLQPLLSAERLFLPLNLGAEAVSEGGHVAFQRTSSSG